MAHKFILTPDQHRELAVNLRANAGQPGHPSRERAELMALNHETIAKIIEGRESGRITAPYWDAPSIVPA